MKRKYDCFLYPSDVSARGDTKRFKDSWKNLMNVLNKEMNVSGNLITDRMAETFVA